MASGDVSMWYKSLSFKLIFSVCMITLFVVGFSTTITLNAQRADLIREIVRASTRITDTVRGSTRYAMLKDDRESVHRSIVAIGAQPGIEKVRVFNKEGEIMFSSDAEDIGRRVDKTAEACYACHAPEKPLEKLDTPERTRIFQAKEGYRVLGMINPIYNEPDCYTPACHAHPKEQKVLGVLDVTMPLEEIDREIADRRRELIIFAVASILLLSTILGLVLMRSVYRPLKELLTATERVAAGDFDVEIHVSGSDEISTLGRSFNKMTGDLKVASRELKQWGKTLEQRVEEKTAELQRTQRQLFHAERMASIGKLAAGIAHEINNPLTGVLTSGQLLLDDCPPDSPDHEDLETIVNETLRCRRIIRGVLDFARQSAPEKRRMRISPVIATTLAFLEHQASFHNIEIIQDIQEDMPHVLIDKDLIQQVFTNILVNASEAMKEVGTLTITADYRPESDQVRVCISDTGCGIPEEDLPKIFDPFYTKKEMGTGLGLAISYGIIAEHGGTIDVQSEPGKGTTFTISLPRASEKETAPAEREGGEKST
jgi:two-component system NtrC family sensor kinase